MARIEKQHVVVVSKKDGRTEFKIRHSDWQKLIESEDVGSLLPLGVLRQFIEHGLTEKSESYSLESGAPWDHWGTLVETFHRVTSTAKYVASEEASTKLMKEVNRTQQPARTKVYSAPTTYLPRNLPHPGTSLIETLRSRRTIRNFDSNKSVSLEGISSILSWGAGVQSVVNCDDFGPTPLYTSPNAGGRGEIQTYLIVRRSVSGLPGGVYHYMDTAHELRKISQLPEESELKTALLNDSIVETAPLLMVMTARLDLISYKYRDPRAYRLWLYNMGHRAQNFSLLAQAHDLGFFQSAAFNDDALSKLLNIEPPEFPGYFMALGRPQEDLNQVFPVHHGDPFTVSME